jgi:hypothetical protein
MVGEVPVAVLSKHQLDIEKWPLLKVGARRKLRIRLRPTTFT